MPHVTEILMNFNKKLKKVIGKNFEKIVKSCRRKFEKTSRNVLEINFDEGELWTNSGKILGKFVIYIGKFFKYEKISGKFWELKNYNRCSKIFKEGYGKFWIFFKDISNFQELLKKLKII